KINGQTIPIILTNTLYAPDATNNLLSISHTDDGDGKVEFTKGKVRIYNKYGNLLIDGEKKHHLYYLNSQSRRLERAYAAENKQQSYTWQEWH
ncbi:hypothetical protein GYMLUDRAFT_110475, partial [Collybiopsis luxurians FD-317 M1]